MPAERPPTPSRADAEREALMQIAALAAAAGGLEEVLEPVADAACEAMDAASVAISRWEPDSRLLRTLVNAGELAPGEERRPADECYAPADHPAVGRLVEARVPYANAIDDPDADPRAVELLRRLGRESDVGVPVVVDGVLWGELWASTRPGAPRLRGTDVRFLEAVSSQLAGLVGREALFSRVSRLAYEDELTGLANRRALEERLDGALAAWQANGTPLTLLVCDVDELKTINDERGHHAGDRALRRVGRSLVKGASPYPGSLVGRISGDEFAVVLPGYDLPAGVDVGTTALQVLSGERDTRIAVSCGAAAAGRDTDRADLLMRAADTAQYAAKRRGGGQVCTAGRDAFQETMAAAGRVLAPPRRRGRRRGIAETLDETQAEVLSMLDGPLARRPVLDRLEAVSAVFSVAVNAAGWEISVAARGDSAVRSISSADSRDARLRGIRVGLEDEVYPLADYPLTAQTIGSGTGTFLVDRYDTGADHAERALLAELGYSSVLGCAVSDIEGAYLIELYADGETRDLAPAGLGLSLLARAAVAAPTAGAADAHRLRQRTRYRDVTSALAAALVRSGTEEEVLEAAVTALHAGTDHRLTAVIQVIDDVEIAAVAARGPFAEDVLGITERQPASVGLIGQVLREGVPLVSNDVKAEPDYRPFLDRTRRPIQPDGVQEIRAELLAPIRVGDRFWGAVDVEDDRATFDADDVALVQAVADQVGSALRSLADGLPEVVGPAVRAS